MSFSPDICKLVLENVLLVEEAGEVLCQLDNVLLKNIWESIRNHFQKQGHFNISEYRDGDYFFWGNEWEKKEDAAPLASFCLDYEGVDCEDRTWLSILGGLVPGAKGGLFLWYEWWNVKGIGKRDWKSFLKNFFIRNPALQDNGFILNDEGTAIIKPFKINLSCFADNLKNPSSSLDELDAALEAIYAQRNIFENLLKEADKIKK